MSQVYDGKAIRVIFDGTKCIHSRNCVLTLPHVFRANVPGAWIDPDAATPEEIATLSQRCPSGAITYERLDGAAAEPTPRRNVVAVTEAGPYHVRADLRVATDPPATRATLCRCGASANKPYCDGSHKAAGFDATGECPSAAEIATLAEGGPLEVKPLPNGPLAVTGPVEVVAGSGRTVQRGTRLFLCRCGASGNKPFCDGSHRAAGFSAP